MDLQVEVVADAVAPNWDEGVNGTEVPQLIKRDDRFIRVEAGPGTGKTFGLKRRVVRILHPQGLGVDPQQVLVVAFNRVIAADLRNEIKGILTSYGIEDRMPWVMTVHSLCLEILGQTTRLLMPHERKAMLYDILEENVQEKAQFARHSDAEQALQNHEAGHEQHPLLWQLVQQWLTRHRAQLISDLPSCLLDHIRAGDFPDRRFRHILVDEFQDLTSTQHALVFALLANDGRLVALGDRRQSIYRFLGNDPEGLARLDELAGATVCDVPITTCHRCPELIVSAANRLMGAYGAAPMGGGNGRPPNTHVVTWPTPLLEATGMARAIIQNIEAYPQDKHLVMVPRRAYGYLLRDALKALRPDQEVDLNFQEGVLEEWAVREAFLFFCLMTDPDPATWRAWFAYQNDVTGDQCNAQRRNSRAYLSLLQACGDEITAEHVEALGNGQLQVSGAGAKNLKDRADRFVALRAHVAIDTDNAELAVQNLLRQDVWITASYNRDRAIGAQADLDLLLNAANATLASEISGALAAPAKLQKLARSLRAQVATRDLAHEATEGSVKITTLWSAKGVTANHVYVLGLSDEAIPGSHRDSYPGTETDYIEEQCRLFYVTMTRSKGTLVLSRALQIHFAVARQWGLHTQGGRDGLEPLRMCRFLRDIIGDLPAAVDGAHWPGCVAG